VTPYDVWFGTTWSARIVRVVLSPFSLLFRGIVAIRNILYDHSGTAIIESPIPAVSIGNISVGGTGKTPVTAYVVRRMLDRGVHPAVVMRGYGDDEFRVHALLNPGARVYTDRDRARGIASAARDGADVAVLDDAFQHRRAGRAADIVLVAAEQWSNHWLLPAGPLREPMRALRRASLIIVTHKVTDLHHVAHIAADVRRLAPSVPVATVHLRPEGIRKVGPCGVSDVLRVEELRGVSVLGIAAVGDPRSFFEQLRAIGAVVEERTFPDHHDYTAAEVASLATIGAGHKHVVTTLKDAVKLTELWPAKGAPLWYVSQAVEVSGGAPFIDAVIARFAANISLS